jgi:hypothetical protein
LMVFVLKLTATASVLPYAVVLLAYTAGLLPVAIRASSYRPAEANLWDCQGCGYPLIGLSSTRCPECGEPFDRTWLTTLTPGMDQLKESVKEERTRY